MEPTQLLTTNTAAKVLCVSTGTLKRWRRHGVGPEWCRLGGRAIRYPAASLAAWLQIASHANPNPEQAGARAPI